MAGYKNQLIKKCLNILVHNLRQIEAMRYTVANLPLLTFKVGFPIKK